MTGSLQTRLRDPMPLLEHSGCALQSVESSPLRSLAMNPRANGAFTPVCALKILAVLSTPPVIKYTPSGDQARSYISAPLDVRHICLILQVSLSPACSSPIGAMDASAGTHSRTLPSSPADASISPKIPSQFRNPWYHTDQRRRTFWRETHNIDRLRMSRQSRQVGDLSIVSMGFDAPELNKCQFSHLPDQIKGA